MKSATATRPFLKNLNPGDRYYTDGVLAGFPASREVTPLLVFEVVAPAEPIYITGNILDIQGRWAVTVRIIGGSKSDGRVGVVSTRRFKPGYQVTEVSA